MAEKNKVILVNKHYNSSEKIKEGSFNENETYRKGEIVVSNDAENPGVAILNNDGMVVLIKNQDKEIKELSGNVVESITELSACVVSAITAIVLSGSTEGVDEKLNTLSGNLHTEIIELSGNVDSKISSFSGAVESALEDAGKVKSVNGQIGEVELDIPDTKVVSGLVTDVNVLKISGLTPGMYDEILQKAKEQVMAETKEYVDTIILEKTAETGRVFCTQEQFDIMLQRGTIDKNCMYYISEGEAESGETESGSSAVVSGTVLEIAGADVVNGVLELGGTVDENGILSISGSKGGSSEGEQSVVSGDTLTIMGVSVSGSSLSIKGNVVNGVLEL